MSIESSTGSQRFEIFLSGALVEASSLAQRLVVRGGASMMNAALRPQNNSDCVSLIDARQALLRCQDRFVREFPDCLKAAVDAADEQREQVAPALTFDALELIAEDQLNDTIELMRAKELVSSAVESELVQFNAMVSAARGLRVVSSSANPLRPEVWVRALRDATLRCEPSAASRLHWMHHLGSALGPELAEVFRVLCAALRQQGVAAASFQAAQASLRPASSNAAASRQAGGHSSGNELARLTLRDLRRLLVGAAPAGDGSGDAVDTQSATTADAGLTVPFAFEALKTLEKPDQVLRRMQEKHASGAWSRSAAGRSGSEATAMPTPAQALSQEVVTLMVENIAADVRLLDTVQNVVRELLPALVRLVADDTRFFIDKQHPARQMLEEMTQRGQAWSTPSQPGYAAFFEPLHEVVQSLSALPTVKAEAFGYALHTLRQAWSDAEAAERGRRAATARALVRAEARNLMAGTVAAELQARPDLPSAPTEIRRFIMGPWCQVMAAARVAQKNSSSADPGGYGAIINDLIWTSQPRLTASNPGRLAKLVPPLLRTLHKGLGEIEYSPEASRPFFDFLERVHCLDPGSMAEAAKEAVPSGETSAVHDELRMIPWFSPSEIGDSSLMQVGAPEASEFLSTITEGADDGTQGEHRAVDVADLQPGRFVDVLVRGGWVRWRLNWVSPQGLLLMFVSDKGKSESMTRQMLDRMIGLGALRLLPKESVVEGALDAVARTALDRSIHWVD